MCATTALTEIVNEATDNTSATGTSSIQVASVEHLAPGDRIWVGQEAAVVKAVAGSRVSLVEPLIQGHEVGTDVIEVLRIEFRLVKVRQIGGQAGTSLALWVGKDRLQADVSNLDQKEAAYQVSLEVGESYQEGTTTIASAVQKVSAGQSWSQQVDYDFSEKHEIQFSLFRDGKIAYQRMELGCYPSLFLWVHVA